MKRLFIVLFFNLLLLLSACDKGVEEASTQGLSEGQTPKTVAWYVVEDNKVNKRVLSGKVTAAKTTYLSFESSGKVENILVQVGQHFESGEVLAIVDSTPYHLQLKQAKAALVSATAAKNKVQKDLRRFESLLASGTVAKTKVEAFRMQFTTMQENVNAAQAQIELATKQVNDTKLRAPFAGSVTAQLAEVGQLVGPAVPVFAVEGKQLPEVSLSVPENLMSSVALGQTVGVLFPAQPEITGTKGKIIEISSHAILGAFPVKVQLKNAPLAVKSGMTAEVELQQINAEISTQTIPVSALGAGENNTHYVYRVVGETDLLLEKVPVTVVSFSEDTVIVMGEIASNDRIVRSGVSFLSPNQPVKLMNTGVRTINP